MDRDAAARARGKGDSQSSAYQRQLKGDRSSRGARVKSGGIFQSAGRARTRQQGESFDKSWGYDQLAEGVAHVGYLVNMQPTTVAKDDRIERSGIDLYYLKQDGTTFKTTLMHEPYFYVACKPQWSRIVVSMLTRKFEGVVSGIDAVEMEDLDLPNHLSGIRALYLRLRFRSVGELMDVRNEVQQAVRRNRARAASTDVYEDDEVRSAVASGVLCCGFHAVWMPCRVSLRRCLFLSCVVVACDFCLHCRTTRFLTTLWTRCQTCASTTCHT